MSGRSQSGSDAHKLIVSTHPRESVWAQAVLRPRAWTPDHYARWMRATVGFSPWLAGAKWIGEFMDRDAVDIWLSARWSCAAGRQDGSAMLETLFRVSVGQEWIGA